MSEFAGKRVVVTGGDSALGVATARAFMDQGGHVILVCTDPAQVATLRTTLGPIRLGPLLSALDSNDGCAGALGAAGGPVFGVVALPHGPGADDSRDRRIAAALAGAMPAGQAGRLVLCGGTGGAVGLVPDLARRLAPDVLVNGVVPGVIDAGGAAPAGVPLRRAARVEDIAGVIRFLCSRDASYVTGQVIRVDGGQGLG